MSAMRLAIVAGRYGMEVLGGAETFARELAEHLPRDRYQVTVLTTCARDLQTWANEYPAGASTLNGVPVLRFPIDHARWPRRRYQDLIHRILVGSTCSVDDEYDWIDSNPHSPELYAHIAARGADYDLLLFVPYVFGATYYGALIHPGKSVVWGCLHDEPFAHFLATRIMLNTVRGVMYTSPPERQMAEERLGVANPRGFTVGFGMADFAGDGRRFRERFQIEPGAPIVLYSGRMELMKNTPLLLSAFERFKAEHPASPARLVLMGKGDILPPRRKDMLATGFLTGQDKLDGYAAATVNCQPSLMESFSIVLMEGWLAGKPALVHSDCNVTRYFAEQSKGGLHFADELEFAAMLDWLLSHPDEAAAMGGNGRRFVLEQFAWPEVLARFDRAVAQWVP